MKAILPAFAASLLATLTYAQIAADFYPRLLFSDDFSGTGFGKRWGHYKSGSVVKDGVLVGITPDGSDHPAVDSVTIDPERDLEVALKFRFVSERAKAFNVWFDDRAYKGSHAGHICSVYITPKAVRIADAKTGTFRMDIYEKKMSPEGLSPEDKAFLETKTKSMPIALAQQDWHPVVIRTKDDTLEVAIDGKVVGGFKSEGIAHESKTLVSLTTHQVDVQYDDFSIKAAAKP